MEVSSAAKIETGLEIIQISKNSNPEGHPDGWSHDHINQLRNIKKKGLKLLKKPWILI